MKDDANASSSIIDSFIQFNQNQYNDDTIYGMIPITQLINQVNQTLLLPFLSPSRLSNYIFISKHNFLSQISSVLIDFLDDIFI